jgi:hypothetical protein
MCDQFCLDRLVWEYIGDHREYDLHYTTLYKALWCWSSFDVLLFCFFDGVLLWSVEGERKEGTG